MRLRKPLFSLFASLMAGLCLAQETEAPKPDAVEIMQRSLGHWREDLNAERNYTYQKREVQQELDKDGNVKKTEIKTYDVSIIYGEPYEKLIAKDDRPLSDKEQQKEDEKQNKFFEKQQKKSDEEREKEQAKEQQKFKREIADELPRMLKWQLVGEDEVSGRPTWVLTATPSKDYHPNSMGGRLLSKLNGKVWITKEDYQWAKVDATLQDDFTVGLFLFKLHKGMHLVFEQTRVNDEVWLPKSASFQGSGRVAMMSGRFNNDTTFSNYRKFKTDAKVTGVVEEVPASSSSSGSNPSPQ